MHLFNKENIWSKPCSFLHTSSHPDKNNNTVDRIISKEKEREDPRRDSSKTSFQLESKSVSSVSTRNPVTTSNSTYRINSTTRNYNYKAHPMQIARRHPPATAPHASKYSTWQKQGSKHPPAFQGPYSTSRLPVLGRNSILHGRQASTHSLQQCPGELHLVLQE